MRRGKSQVLYRYLPGMFADYNKGKCIAIVSSWDSREMSDISKKRVMQKVYRNFPKFRSVFGFHGLDDLSSYEIMTPRGVEVEVFPLTFICSRCGRALQFRDTLQLETWLKSAGSYACPTTGCKGKLMQKGLVYVHTCGFYDGLNITPCKEHGYKHIRFNEKGSKSIGDWRWTCGICGADTSSLNQLCRQCRKVMYPMPVGASSVFYPHSETMVNLHKLTEKGFIGNEQFYKLVIAKYLGLIEEYDIDELASQKSSDESKEKMETFLEELKQKGMDDEVLKMTANVYKKSHPPKLEIKDKAIAHVDNVLTGNNNVEELALGLFEYMEALKTFNKMSVDELLKKAERENHPNLHIINTFPEQIRKIGAKNAYVIGDLSILNIVYGYTRGSVETKNCVLRAFPEDRGSPGKTPMYANQNDTEGLLIELDRYKILKWLKENNVISNIPCSKEPDMKTWFLNNVNLDNIDTFNEIPEEDKITKAVYVLVHSMAHALLIKASVQCGLDKDSLGELIFPTIPAIVIYSTNNRFQLGGMFTLFESKIYPWIDRTMDKVKTCVYDPLCIHSAGACHACLFTSEISCIHFNRDLSRAFLIGRESSDEKGKIVGYWEKNFIESFDD